MHMIYSSGIAFGFVLDYFFISYMLYFILKNIKEDVTYLPIAFSIFPCFIPFIFRGVLYLGYYHYSVFNTYVLYAIIVLGYEIKRRYQLSWSRTFYTLMGLVVSYILFKVVFLGFG